MATGPGKYDDICTTVRVDTNAQAAIVIILNGDRGSGFSLQSFAPIDAAVVADLLEGVLKQLRMNEEDTTP